MKRFVFSLAVASVPLACLANFGAAVHAKPNTHVSIKIAVEPKVAASGCPIWLRISLRNRSRLPVRFVNSGGPWRFFTCERAGLNGRWVNIPLTRWGRMVMGTLMPMGGPIRPMHQVDAGKAKLWGHAFPLSRCYDLTLPAGYRLRVVTQRPIYLVDGPMHAYLDKGGTLQATTSGKALYLPSFAESMKGFAPAAVLSKGRACSNSLKLRVLPPGRLRQAKSALAVAGPVPLGENTMRRKGPLLSIVQLPSHGRGFLVLARVTVRGGKKPERVALTGNPLIDFYNAQVDGPDGRNGSELINKPTPHYVPIPNWKAVPLTAYGKWLKRHRSQKGLKWGTYTLKPGVVYKYAVPVNLSCRLDLSLPGVYHVRLRLAHTHMWSPWVRVTVPPN